MDPAQRITKIRAMIRYWDQLSSAEQNDLRTNRRRQRVIVLSRGCYILSRDWEGLYNEGRQIAVALAHSDREVRTPVFSHYTAAALLGLPLYRFSGIRVHETYPQNDVRRSTARVMRHEGTLAEHEITEIAGVRVTNVNRTVLDLARLASAELALGCMDAALNLEFFADRESSVDAQEIWRETAIAKLDGMPGARGVRRARRVLEFADGRAESVLESVGRLRFARAGILVEIQVRVPGPNGHNLRPDFELLDHGAFAEADGVGKYFEKEMASGKDAKQLLREEKAREDWIRGTTKKMMYRFGIDDVETQERFEARFASFGVFGDPKLRNARNRLP
ncbi:hypothetical protein G7068_04140 [Leucobacter viscericola]|uniref:Transcriptional regulator, AbiEi antitoxin, Type IV TA system n=1 Tax=Leucobacter viscericola TaxID=2714935 RepID=A0A6G7XDG9_9MICO|nr:hypothetical protein [Leucobacter viscericola]QIK62489.1 hypothetical protein G7068_04140 [Leucobacter viscericola]